MSGAFDFAPSRQVVTEIAPDEISAVSFRGWEFTAKPSEPYRPKFKVILHGMRWYLNTGGTAFDTTTNPTFNAARLRAFYIANRQWDTFSWVHETLGTLTVRFAGPVNIPEALPNSGGLLAPFEVMLIQQNPGY